MSENAAAPLWTYRFQRTRADWAAYEALPGEVTGWRKWILFVFAALLGGLWVAAEAWLFDDEPGLWHWGGLLVVVAMAYALTSVTLSLDRRCVIARRPVPQGETIVEVHPDHLAVSEEGGTRIYSLELLQRPVLTAAHVFVPVTRQDIAILPLRAFEDEADMRAFARWLDGKIEESDALQEMNDVESAS